MTYQLILVKCVGMLYRYARGLYPDDNTPLASRLPFTCPALTIIL